MSRDKKVFEALRKLVPESDGKTFIGDWDKWQRK